MKAPPQDPFRERLLRLARMLTLTWKEQALIVWLLISLLIGSLARHYRAEWRLAHAAPTPAASSTPRNFSP